MLESGHFGRLNIHQGESFPKSCSCCRATYRDVDAFFKNTRPSGTHQTGLRQASDDDGVIVEAYRNCACGSTLLVFFEDRRETLRPVT
ncbi:Uncharacterised protein [BD1-7 clade bacterium]|uniref:Uncharacterized protein n=1 Tax=BD1-7 clade bacterium TaxID=2029982 RepID=A0A5S9P4U9_9GAMM|nr:Uncharacterised protein [BD1-7 clade bacterium]CAA0098434.1 Uncharacterised protein [BD1-7 clade bacterium]